MENLYFLQDSTLSGYNISILNILGFIAIISGILVIITSNPVISVLYLICLFVNMALYLILLDLNFLGLVYILVYVGAIAILFLFIIMLLNIKLSELQDENTNQIPVGGIIGALFLYPIYNILPNNINDLITFTSSIFHMFTYLITGGQINLDNDKLELGYIYEIKSYQINLFPQTDLTSIGNIMYTDNLMWFLISAFILLLAMIGAIILSYNPKNK